MRLHNVADLFVWGAYIAIPFVLLFYARKRKNLPFKHLFWLFGLFIAACGTTHLMAYVTTITPVYRLDGLIKLITAVASWGTVIAIAAISPRALSMRMPEDLEQEIADRKRAEEELAILNTTLRNRTLQIEEANAELEGFTYIVSHDLRAPLRSIVARSRMVIEEMPETLPAETRQHLDRLSASALKMASLVDELLRFTRLGRHEPALMEVDMSVIAKGVAEELKAEFDAQFDIEEGMSVQADPQLARLVLYNLMHNACKYARQETEPHVQVGSIETKNGPAIVVRDNGIGFDMAHVTRIFQPFERLHREEEVPGTGIGLANVKRVIERMGGIVWAESVVGEGSCFYFILSPTQEVRQTD